MARGLFRVPSLNKRIAARTSVKRLVRHSLGLKAPRGLGWITNPRKAAYNRMYSRSSIGCALVPLVIAGSLLFSLLSVILRPLEGKGQ